MVIFKAWMSVCDVIHGSCSNWELIHKAVHVRWQSPSMQIVPVPTDDLLSKEYAKRRRTELYNPNKVMLTLLPEHSHPGSEEDHHSRQPS